MTEVPENIEVVYEFGDFVLDPRERVLTAGGQPVRLSDKVFDTLLFFVRHPGRLATKDELIRSIWDESFVEEGNLAKNISRLRKVLNVDGTDLIETIPRHGYRFLGEVTERRYDQLLVSRNLHVRIKHTREVEPADRRITKFGLEGWKLVAVSAAIVIATLTGLAIYFFRTPTGNAASASGGAFRLTETTANDTQPVWTHDGRVRFLRIEADKSIHSMIVNADGTGLTDVRDLGSFDHGIWSPYGSKAILIKPGDRSSIYLGNSTGSDADQLPFSGGNFDWSADGEKIVYQKNVTEGDPDIFVYTLATGKSVDVTNDPGFDADPAFSPDGKLIVFTSLRDGNAELYLMNSDGTDVHRLTNHPAWDNHPSFSPDGTEIVFSSDRDDETGDVYVMAPIAGGEVRRLTDWRSTESVNQGSWSPDGSRILITSDRSGSDNVYIVSAETHKPTLVLANDTSDLKSPALSPDGKLIAYDAIDSNDKVSQLRVYDVEQKTSRLLQTLQNTDGTPVFSPDGQWIAFQGKFESDTEIYSIRPDGTEMRDLSQNPSLDFGPAFSSDGTKIIFSSNRGGNTGIYQLYTMNVDGSDQKLVYSNDAMSVSPSFSPDGRDIYFANDREGGRIGNFEVFRYSPGDAGSLKRLTFRTRVDGQPVVSPDGKRIAFASDQDGNWEIYVMNSDGSNLLRLTRNPAADDSPRWSPDGKRMIFSSNRTGKFAIYEITL